ncbi:hypothetical protein ES708_10985 [subsurface metagenome]
MKTKYPTIISILFIIVLLILSSSCGPSEPLQFVTYTSKTEGFSIDYPDSWNAGDSKEPQVKVAIWEKEFGLNPIGMRVAKYAAPGYNMESFAEFQINALPDITKDYISFSTEKLTISGIPAIKHTYTHTVGPTTYKSVKAYLVENGTGWILGFDSPQKSFDSYKSIFETSLNSFRLFK